MLEINKRYKIKKFNKSLHKSYRHKLLSMGMLPGAIFKVIRFAPLGDTVQIEINHFSLSLRASELHDVSLEEHHND